ncbi:hypothetical protein SAMN05444266_10680 [Chitinophaga jiangningensis]|uniref:Por secretion system C-terminal sorting domain-containing protein n=1 Tax=Chitinophaga jiangningensis TaxID=1419482 RepID=A0A1M7FC90_9BACT|nr:hypothetical protein [Chitinophaga jiangningensis]SHM01565.1 hypothetical protein SAMN05444266_10680 [Chitinophaga jiangningensis]
MALFGQDTVAVFGDMTHEGNILSMPGSVLNFYGLRWRNNSGAAILDESSDGLSGNGGWFQFIQQRNINPNVVYQYMSGGYNVSQNGGTIFPNLRVFNSPGLILDDLNDLKISHELDLRKGSIFLNGWNLVVGHHTPGTIRNFSDSNFIVTDGRFGSGFLYRSNLQPADGEVVFPVGTRPSSFTPAVVAVKTGSSTVRTGVSDSVLAGLTQGRNLFTTSVNKTWQIDPLTPNTEMGVTLVHKLSDEGPDYEANRNSSYVAYFNGSNWDTARTRSAPVSPNIYTSGTPNKAAAFNTRTFQLPGNNGFFTSMVAEIINSPSKTALQFFDAFRNDIASDSITLRWATIREYFLRGISIERKRLDAANFDSIGFVVTKSPNGISYVPVGYDTLDIQDTEESLLYRLKVIMTDGYFFYSPIRLVKGKFVDGQIRLWPNPVRAGTVLHIYYAGALHIKAMALIDVPGRRVGYTTFPQPLQNRNYYEIDVPSGLSGGNYYLQFIGEDNQIIHVEKVVIINRL